MKTLQKILGVSVAVALLGLNLVMADVVRSDPDRTSLKFSLNIGDDAFDLPEISFDADEEAQATCAMTPGGSTPSQLLSPPQFTMPRPEQLSNAPRSTLAPIGTIPPAQTSYPTGRRRPMPPPVSQGPQILVPEPATLLIVGLGIGAVAVVRQRGKRISKH